MGLPVTVGCDTAWDRTRVCSDAYSTAMQCLRPLRHSGGPQIAFLMDGSDRWPTQPTDGNKDIQEARFFPDCKAGRVQPKGPFSYYRKAHGTATTQYGIGRGMEVEIFDDSFPPT